ncbi:MAG: ABC transporter substrate-binding protein [Halobacteriales archaeon]
MSLGPDRSDVPDEKRRELLRNLGVGATAVVTAGLAGCGGDGDDTDTPTEGETDTPGGGDGTDTPGNGGTPTATPRDLVDSTWSTPTDRVPENVHWNNYNPASQAGASRNWVQTYMVGFRQSDATFVPSPVFKDITVEGTTMTITVDDSVTWHNGDALTAEDVVTQVKMDIFMEQPPADVIDSASVASDTEAELTLSTQNREIALGAYAGRRLNTKKSIYGKFVNQFEESGTPTGTESVRGQVASFEGPATGLGPFTVEEATTRAFRGPAHEGHPAYDVLEGVSWEATRTTGNQGILQMGISGTTDYIGPIVLSEDALSQLPGSFQINPTSNLNGHGLFWNYSNPHIKRKAFRKAIAYIADRKTIAKNAAGLNFKEPVGTPTGISGGGKGVPKSWLGDTFSKLTAYETSTDKATTVLESAGYSKSGGTWQGPDGNTVSLDLVYPGGWTDWVNAGQTLNSQLNNFGFETNFQTVDAPTWNGQTRPNGEFDITPQWWGGGRPHPFFGFRAITQSGQAGDANVPDTFEVPMPVGDTEGNLQEVNITEETNKLPNLSGEEATQAVVKLAWTVNQAVPILPIMEKIGAVWYNTERWDVPASDNKWMSVNPPTHLAWPLQEGKITPMTE